MQIYENTHLQLYSDQVRVKHPVAQSDAKLLFFCGAESLKYRLLIRCRCHACSIFSEKKVVSDF